MTGPPVALAPVTASPVWPASAGRGGDGVLVVGGVPADRLAATHGTPLFVLDEADARARMAAWRAALPDGDVHYAGKAFLCAAWARWLVDAGLSLDVCTGGELALAAAAQVPGDRITVHGNNKLPGEIAAAVGYGVGRVVLDATEELARVASAAGAAGVRQRVLLRVTPGVQAHTHEYISTGGEESKFGFLVTGGEALDAVGAVLAAPEVDLAGLHCHVGSQVMDPQGHVLAARRMVALIAAVRDRYGVVLAELDLGGGAGIAYVAGEVPPEPARFVATLRAAVAQACAEHGLPVPRLAVEPGRAIAGPPTLTVYRVGTVKQRPAGHLVVAVDGGMSDNIRTALYGARYTATLANRHPAAGSAPLLPARVVGRHCESGDVVVADARLPADTAAGDLVAVAATGAYGYAMASTYNRVGRPAVVAVREGAARVLLARESDEDLLRLDMAL